jgi:peptidoglycan-N-acetylglucosamine deacetylase
MTGVNSIRLRSSVRVPERFVRYVYRYAGGSDASGADSDDVLSTAEPRLAVHARRVPDYPPARGGEAWLLDTLDNGSSDWDARRRAAAGLLRAEPRVPVFVEVGSGSRPAADGQMGDMSRLERAGFRRSAARFSILGFDRYVVPQRGQLPSLGELGKRALAGIVPASALVVRGDPRSHAVHLTFDDGPHPEHTPRLLDALAAACATATFFVVGRDAEKHPDIVRRIAAEGHTIGHHSFTHGPPRRTSARALMEEVRRTVELLRDILGYAPRLFRPPRGQLTSQKLVRLWLARQKIVLWNVDPRDFACASPADLAAAMDEGQLTAGDIVLLHDDTPLLPPILTDLARGLGRRGLDLRALEPEGHHGD